MENLTSHVFDFTLLCDMWDIYGLKLFFRRTLLNIELQNNNNDDQRKIILEWRFVSSWILLKCLCDDFAWRFF